MTETQRNDSETVITIPINGIGKLTKYEQGIRALLRKVEVGNCDPELMEHVKSVYELLSRLAARNSSCDERSRKAAIHS